MCHAVLYAGHIDLRRIKLIKVWILRTSTQTN